MVLGVSALLLCLGRAKKLKRAPEASTLSLEEASERLGSCFKAFSLSYHRKKRDPIIIIIYYLGPC